MPEFDVEVTVQAKVDFEVFCGSCGAGLCNQSDTRHSRSRAYAQVTVMACESCIESAREKIRMDLEGQILDLQAKLDRLGYSDD